MSTSQFGTIFELGAARLLDLGHQSQLLAHSFGLIDQSLVGLNPDLVCVDVDGRCSSEGERVPVRTCYCPGCPDTTSLGSSVTLQLFCKSPVAKSLLSSLTGGLRASVAPSCNDSAMGQPTAVLLIRRVPLDTQHACPARPRSTPRSLLSTRLQLLNVKRVPIPNILRESIS